MKVLGCLLSLVAAGGPGHGPMHLLVESAGIIGLSWDPLHSGWTRPLGLISTLRLLFEMLGVQRSVLTFVADRVFGEARCWTLLVLFSSYVPHM